MTSGPDKKRNRQAFCKLMSSGAHRIKTSQYIYHTVEANYFGLFRAKGKLFCETLGLYHLLGEPWGEVHCRTPPKVISHFMEFFLY